MPYIDMRTPSQFEWDADKAEANFLKHGVPFEAAVDVFLDVDRLEEADTRRSYAEERYNTIGIVSGVCFSVTFTMRDGIGRIISARRASRKERKRYARHSQDA
jgi:uncharacterized DUF497 family protein